MKTERLKINLLEQNLGQIEGLPSNPRQWKKDEVARLKKSLEETPELFEARGCIVYPFNGKYIVLGGNMRLFAAKQLKMKDVPCIILPETTSVSKLKEIVIKDNGSFGEWDMDILANEWDDLPLSDWGVNLSWDAEEAQEGRKEVQEDDFDETKEEIKVRCKKGDIWQLGEHRLMCGDSINLEDVKRLMGGGKG